ncbi:hypothetical protein IH785_04615 [candidate division KSB1 bacterium]|nr:hypothetical protein [candidate division KSB1 bacterium]
MKNKDLKRHFEAIGAKVKFHLTEKVRWRWDQSSDHFTIGIQVDKNGEYFDIVQGGDAPEFELLQAQPKTKHLLLYTKEGQRFLCGHDERHWFVAAIGGKVSTVRAAKQSLLPKAIWKQVKHLPPREVDNRRNAVFKRQGEWFFVKTNRKVPKSLIHKNEFLQRNGGSKSHICQEIYREGGGLVYIVGNKEMDEKEYSKRKKSDPTFDKGKLKTFVRNPSVYARGYIKHEDHATIRLECWHRVFINAEFTTSAVSFLD